MNTSNAHCSLGAIPGLRLSEGRCKPVNLAASGVVATGAVRRLSWPAASVEQSGGSANCPQRKCRIAAAVVRPCVRAQLSCLPGGAQWLWRRRCAARISTSAQT